MGHAGTLDPLASGVLLVLLGDATKVSRFLLGLPKEYVAGVLFGTRTDTDDVTGKTVEQQPVPEVSAEQLRAVLECFVGETEQIPPAFSAIKQDGRPLYRLARSGQTVDVPPRRVTVYELELVELNLPRAALRCRVSAGTYVRALARDIGAALDTVATLESLKRTAIGRFSVADAVELDTLDAASIERNLMPVDRALEHLPACVVTAEDAKRLLQGKPIADRESPIAGSVDAFGIAHTADGRFLAIVRPAPDGLRTERIIYAD
jgi:tRNA pseudouridine55 synthase